MPGINWPDDGLDLLPEIRTTPIKEPAKVWFNWWYLHHVVGNLITGEVLGPGRVRSAVMHKSRDLAETAAMEWVEAHNAFRCQCGFGEHCYIGPFEDGTEPNV